ncbi:MAG: Stk1 family PASTA domain-containing Ser/Thr kinase [Acidimicrobiales bacterium]
MTSTPPADPGEDRARIYNGRYELISQIARGGTAQVYLAKDLLLDRPVALKVLFPELSSDSSFVERFRREAQAAANLSHPNIVPVFDWGESERTYFIVMEYVDGEPLSAIIRGQAPLPAGRAAAIAADITKALSNAHRHGVIHRDVKPGNVLLTRDGQVKVTDFGIARAVGSDDSVTQTGLVMGTATYFSPEQAQGLGVDGRSDVYALGVVLYEMVTGRPPFSADTPVAIAYKHVSEAAVPPRVLEPRVPEALDAIIMRAMAKQPGDRYPTAEDLHADLQRYAQGAPVMAMATAMTAAAMGTTQAIATGMTQAIAPSPTTVLPTGEATGMAAATDHQRAELAGGSQRDEPQMPKRRWVGWVLAGILLAALLGFLVYFGGRQLGYFGAPGYFLMPDVKQANIVAATSTLEKDGLHVRSKAEFSKARKGTVIAESPNAEATVRKGQTIYLTYSGGQKRVAVPGVDNEQYTLAEATLKHWGLNYKLVPVAPTPGAVEGIVTSTSPQAGTEVLPGATVKIYYIHGTAQVKVPTVAGDTLQAADAAITSSRLTLKPTAYAPSATVRRGLVAGTEPPAGSTEPVGTGIVVVISSGPPATVPPVIGDKMAKAESLITAAGLQWRVNYVSGLPSDAGYVTGQSPSGGQEVAKGTTVVIDVVQNSPTTTTTSPATTTTTTTTSPATTTTTVPLPQPQADKKHASRR